jgi:hypothetical protein
MKWKKFDIVYANGSSLSAGGGLEWGLSRKLYKEKYGLEWKDEKDVTYPKYIADHFGVKLIQDAQSGSGAPRLIRRCYDYIQKYGLEVAKRTLFILEITDPFHRIDVWCEKIQDHLIVNVRWNEDATIESLSIQERVSPTDRKYELDFFEGEIKEEILTYLNKYVNPIVYFNKFKGELIGLFSFFEQNDIDYFYMFENGGIKFEYNDIYKGIDAKRKLVNHPTQTSISHYCIDNKLTITDELAGDHKDSHPGYFGNKKFAEEIAIPYIEEQLKPKLFVFGDSFTQSFVNHYDSGSEWFLKYFSYKQTIPKSFCDIISETYDIEIVNHGINGSSNDTMFELFLENLHKIRKQDIVIIGWTSLQRFRIANDLNNLVNVIPFAHHPSPNDDVSVQAIEEIGKNRGDYSVYWSEISNYNKIIKNILKDNIVLFWTWVKPVPLSLDRLFTKIMVEQKEAINIMSWKSLSNEAKENVKNECDAIFDLTKNQNYSAIIDAIDSGKKIALINLDIAGPERSELFYKQSIRYQWYRNIDHQANCYAGMLPWDDYETIHKETNGLIKDHHYSEKGQADLAKLMVDEINAKITHLRELDVNVIIGFDSLKNRGKVDLSSHSFYQPEKKKEEKKKRSFI